MLSSCRLLLLLPLPLPLLGPVPDFIAPSNVPSNVHSTIQHAQLLSFTFSQLPLQQSSVMFFQALMILPCHPSTGAILPCPTGGGGRA